MADEAQYSSGPDTATNKRKYEEQTTPPPPRRPTGFSAPISSTSPDSVPQSYNSVPPPVDEIQLAKQRAQEIAARLFNNASGGAAAAAVPLDAKRARVENGGGGGFDSSDKGFSSAPSDLKPQIPMSAPSSIPVSYGFQGSSKKIDIPNGRVGVIIGKGGETIKYLQLQSGAKIQVTRDMDADLNSATRMVELMGTPEQIAKAEQLITDVLAGAESGGQGVVTRRVGGQAGSDQFVMKIPNNKVGLVIGKGGETIKNMQARTGARIQVIPLHLPPGDTSTERTLQIDGTSEQIESAKLLVNEVISEVLRVFFLVKVSLYWAIGDTNMEYILLVFPQHHSGMVLYPFLVFSSDIVESGCKIFIDGKQG
ncbi:Polyribonucleotide nucleotidyltransferase [Trema orientale]|uniref:Polyribonucleotide nucleotidyltransferase n=1 Tax=Trema orientale TaxID=63057 RepID=A0A2P5EKW0_TREOI|nr:Polyribonucleotide nucleotidyltransferase [Trema orientale]